MVLRLLQKALRESGVLAADRLARCRVDLSLAEELSGALGDAPQQNATRSPNGRVDAVLDRGEEGDEDTGEEDNDFEGRGQPELVHLPRRGDQVADGVDDHGGKGTIGDIEEDGGEGIEGEQDEDGGKDTGERRANTGFSLDGRSRERSGSGVGAEERTEKVGEADGDEFLGWVDDVVIDPTKRFGDGNVFDQQNENGSRNVTTDGREEIGIETGSSLMLETCGISIRKLRY